MESELQSTTFDENYEGTKINLDLIKQDLVSSHLAIDIADLFKALGDPTRVKMIHALLQRELCVHDLTEVLHMGQSAISHQLRFLRNTRIVKRRKVGKTVFYSLDDDHVAQIFAQTLQHLQHD